MRWVASYLVDDLDSRGRAERVVDHGTIERVGIDLQSPEGQSTVARAQLSVCVCVCACACACACVCVCVCVCVYVLREN